MTTTTLTEAVRAATRMSYICRATREREASQQAASTRSHRRLRALFVQAKQIGRQAAAAAALAAHRQRSAAAANGCRCRWTGTRLVLFDSLKRLDTSRTVTLRIVAVLGTVCFRRRACVRVRVCVRLSACKNVYASESVCVYEQTHINIIANIVIVFLFVVVVGFFCNIFFSSAREKSKEEAAAAREEGTRILQIKEERKRKIIYCAKCR